MKRLLIGLCCGLFSCAVLAAGLAAVRKLVQASMLVTGSIIVAPDGSVRSYTIDRAEKLPAVVVGLIGKNVPNWKFEPSALDGRPVAAKATMGLRVVAKPVGDGNYSISIGGVQFGQGASDESISYKHREAPSYPIWAAQARVSGTVYLLLRVGRQGQVEDALAEQVNLGVTASDASMERWRHVLANAALNAARRWTFNTPTSGKHVGDDYWVARVPVNFSLRESGQPFRDAYGQWKAYVPGPRQPVPWFDKGRMMSTGVDALPAGGIYQVDQGLRLTTPLAGA
jgi:hypothetical protein